jgi:hypothetical protein
MPKFRVAVVLGLAVALPLVGGCRADDPVGEAGESGDAPFYEQGVDTPASQIEPAATCPDGAPTLGAAGQQLAEHFPLSWSDGDGEVAWVDGWMYFVIPDDITSLLIAVEHEAEYTALNGMAIDGEWWVDLPNAIGEGPFWHWPIEVASVTMPISEDTLPAGGCLAIDPVVYADAVGESGTLHIVTRRAPAQASTIDVNVFIVGTTQVSDADVMAAVTHMAELYELGGSATLGQVNFSTLDWPDPYVDCIGAEANALRAATGDGEPNAINLLFVQDFNEPGTLGIAAAVPGPNGIPGTAGSGVMVSIDTHLDGDGTTLLTDLMGETMAHEVGHQIGLFHTSEDTGLEFDGIADTPECTLDNDLDGDEEMSAEECEALDGRNFMFWVSSDEFSQLEMSATQAMVLRDSVIARPQ